MSRPVAIRPGNRMRQWLIVPASVLLCLVLAGKVAAATPWSDPQLVTPSTANASGVVRVADGSVLLAYSDSDPAHSGVYVRRSSDSGET